ncbi:MAG: hypothetical protein ABI667_03510 [Sphingomicrobium sp.]
MQLSIGTAWDQTRGIVARDGALIAIVAAALFVLPSALSTLIAPQSASITQESANASGVGGIVQIIMTLISQVGALALTAIALRPGLSIGEALSTGLRRLFPAIGASLLYILPMLVVVAIMLSTFISAGTPEEMLARLKNLSGGQLMSIMAVSIVFLYLALRFCLANAVAVAESSNPVAILKRSWVLTRGHALRLFALLVLIGIVGLVLGSVAGMVGGLLVTLLFGPMEPMTIGALVFGLINGIANAVLITLFVLMLARIYGQLGSTVSVPKVDDIFA